MRIPRLPILLLLVVGAVLAAPVTSAGAQTICVNATGCDKDAKGSLPGALAIAKSLGGPDVVRLGANLGTPYTGPFSYAPGADSTNSVTIQAAGSGRPVLSTLEDQPGTVLDLDDATLKGVEVRVPRVDGLGLELSNSTLEDVAVTGGGNNSDVGIETRGSVRLDRTSVDIEGSNAVINRGTLTADRLTTKGEFLFTGVRDLNASSTLVTRSRLEARSFPLAAGSGGGTVVRSTQLVTTGPGNRLGVVAFGPALTLDHVTVARQGTPDPDSTGLKITPVVNGAVTLRSVVIAGYGHNIVRNSSLGGTATLSVSDSVWDPANDANTGPLTEANNAKVDPKLVDVAGGDLRLRASSAAIDRDVNSDPKQYVDSVGALAVDGNGDGSIRPDAGGVEYRRQGPTIDAATVPGAATVGAPVDVSASASDADGDAVTLAWDFGDGATATGGSASHAYASPGTFTVTLTATDEAGLATKRTFTVDVTVPAVPAAGGGASGGGTPGGDRTAPTLRGAKLSLKKVSVRKAAKKKLALALDVSEAASLRVSLSRGKGPIVKSVPAGKSKFAIAKALKKLGALKKGSLKLTVVATDKAGNRSASKTLKLRLGR